MTSIGGESLATIEKDLVAYRATQLAIVFLTRREDLTVSGCSQAAALDLMVKLTSQKSQENRSFAVVTKGFVSEGKGRRSNRPERLYTNQQQLSELINTSLPVCLFTFNMIGDAGSWRWLLEPVADEAGKHLRINHDLTMAPLTNEVINTIVDAINYWYDVD